MEIYRYQKYGYTNTDDHYYSKSGIPGDEKCRDEYVCRDDGNVDQKIET